MEIKKSANPGKDAVRHFKALESLKLPVGPGCVVPLVSQRLPITEFVQAIPVGIV